MRQGSPRAVSRPLRVVSIALVAAACSGGTDATVESEASATDEPGDAAECTAENVGGSITMGVFSETAGLDPLITRGTGTAGGTEVTAIFDTLVQYDPDRQELEPRVAESIEPNDDFTEWTLMLRSGVTFGNGDPLTADDVKASIERHLDPANAANAVSAVANITEMEVLDDQTLVFRLNAPWGRFPALLAGRVGSIVNPTVLDEMGPEGFNLDPRGAGVGPYEMEEYSPGEELVLRARTDYWGGPVCIEELRFVFIPDAEATYDALRQVELEVAFLRNPQVIAEAKEDGVEGFSVVQNGGALFMLNHAPSAPASDLAVRQAIAAALDPEVINARAWNGVGLPTTALIAEDSALYGGRSGPEPDAQQAAALVDQAKAAGWDGDLELLCFDDPVTQEICLAAKAMLDDAGMNVTIELGTVPAVIERVLAERNFEMSVFGFNIPDADPWARLQGFLHSASNSSGYANPAMDAGLDELRAAASVEEQQAALAGIQETWNETIPHIVYGASEEFIAAADTVRGVEVRQDSIVYFDNAYLQR